MQIFPLHRNFALIRFNYQDPVSTLPKVTHTGNRGYDYDQLGGTTYSGRPCKKLGMQYRTPTCQQFIDLCAASTSDWGSKLNGKPGRFHRPGATWKLMDITSVPTGMIFIPSARIRGRSNGIVKIVTCGYYLSSSVSAVNGYNMHHYYAPNDGSMAEWHGNVEPNDSYVRSESESVRCLMVE